MKLQMATRRNPITANTMTRTDARLDHFISISGRSKHSDRLSSGDCPWGHSVQFISFIRLLIVPVGHLRHSQQHGVVTDLKVPLGQSSWQKDFGTNVWLLIVFHLILPMFNSSFFLRFFSHEPITSFTGSWLSNVSFVLKWTMS